MFGGRCFLQPWHQIPHRHRQKFGTAVPIPPDGALAHLQESQCLAIVDPHRQWIPVNNGPHLFPVCQFDLRSLHPGLLQLHVWKSIAPIAYPASKHSRNRSFSNRCANSCRGRHARQRSINGGRIVRPQLASLILNSSGILETRVASLTFSPRVQPADPPQTSSSQRLHAPSSSLARALRLRQVMRNSRGIRSVPRLCTGPTNNRTWSSLLHPCDCVDQITLLRNLPQHSSTLHQLRISTATLWCPYSVT